MAIYAADFGITAAAAVPGLTEYSAAGAVAVARSTAGIVHLGQGFFVRDFTPNVSTAVLVWDADGVYAREPIAAAGVDAAGIRSAIGLSAANLDTQIGDLPTTSELATALSGADDATLAAISALNNLSSAQAQSAATAALNAYDPPTKAEMDSKVDALNNLSSVQAQAAAAAALTAYDPPTKTEMDSKIDALNNLSSVQAQAAAAAAITAAGLATASALTTTDGKVDTVVTAVGKIDDTVELNAGTYRFTAASLANVPAPAVDLDPQTIRDAMKLAPTAGAAAAGSVDAHLDTIEAKTNTIGAGAVAYTSPMLAGGDATIYAGQDHTGSRALTWAVTGYAGPALAGNTAKLRIQRASWWLRSAASRKASMEYSATVTQSGTDVSVSVSLTDAQTSAINPGAYHGQVIATVAGADTIVVDFELTVGKAMDAPVA